MTGFKSKREAALDKVAQPVQEPVAWKNAAIRLGEELSSVGPDGYYDMTAQQWLDWALEQEPRGKNSLAQPEQEPVATMKMLHTYGDTTPPKQEPRNFCPRCGKRTPDLTTIHTCTPPRGLEMT